MPQSLPDELAKEIRFQNGRRVSDKIVQLISVDETGWPFVTLLSFHEVLVESSEKTLLLVVHAGGRTSDNLKHNGKVTLVFAIADGCYYIRGIATIVSDVDTKVEGFGQALARVHVDKVLQDANPQAPITSGLAYDPTRVVDDHLRVLEKVKNLAEESSP